MVTFSGEIHCDLLFKSDIFDLDNGYEDRLMAFGEMVFFFYAWSY